MNTILLASLVYVVTFGLDYLFYVKLKSAYNYVSRRTYVLFIIAQATSAVLFLPYYQPFLEHFVTEVVMLAIITLFLYVFAYALIRDRLKICSMSSRSLRCLSPGYVFVKGSEIVFQQLIYAAIAFSLVQHIGLHFYTYVAFVLILLSIHVAAIIGGKQQVVKSLTLGLALISIPSFYIYTEIGHFWPAIYLHSLLYVFYWLVIADFDVKPEGNTQYSG